MSKKKKRYKKALAKTKPDLLDPLEEIEAQIEAEVDAAINPEWEDELDDLERKRVRRNNKKRRWD